MKAASDNSWQTAAGDQVSKYWKRYGLVLVTNYRQFIILGGDEETPDGRQGLRLTVH